MNLFQAQQHICKMHPLKLRVSQIYPVPILPQQCKAEWKKRESCAASTSLGFRNSPNSGGDLAIPLLPRARDTPAVQALFGLLEIGRLGWSGWKPFGSSSPAEQLV